MATELTAEEEGIVDIMVARAERWEVHDNGLINILSHITANDKEEDLVGKLYDIEQEECGEWHNRVKTEAELLEEKAWDVAGVKKEIKRISKVNQFLADEKAGKKVVIEVTSEELDRGVVRGEMLVEFVAMGGNIEDLGGEI